MKYVNLQRAGEIAAELPSLERARQMLSDVCGAYVVVRKDGEQVILPERVNMNVVNVINFEINKLREEISEL